MRNFTAETIATNIVLDGICRNFAECSISKKMKIIATNGTLVYTVEDDISLAPFQRKQATENTQAQDCIEMQGKYTNGLYSRNPGILFALDKGLKSVNCTNYPNFIQKAVSCPRKKFPPLTVVYLIKDTKIQTCFLNNVWI